MVAKVISGKNIQGALNYNEHKVAQGTAQCIMASGFLKEGHHMTFYEKLKRFKDLNAHNTRSKTNTLHVSLNFDVSEKLKQEQLQQIASTYMDKIGFGNQPYLVYQHYDAAHPHVHILTTLIRQDGHRIPIHYLGQNKSEKARREIEKEFKLVVAEEKSNTISTSLKPQDLQKVIYGKTQTKRSIARIVSEVTRTYAYTSLPELNAVLHQFNVEATRGSENSVMFQKRGLLYSIIDAKGRRVGVPIKASALPHKPMLAVLEKQFERNQARRLPSRHLLKKKIDHALASGSVNSLPQLIATLAKKQVVVVPRINAEGRLFGITFIDHSTRTVFNGSALGKNYSAAAVMDKLAAGKPAIAEQRLKIDTINIVSQGEERSDHSPGVLPQLLQSENDLPLYAPRLTSKRKRKKHKPM